MFQDPELVAATKFNMLIKNQTNANPLFKSTALEKFLQQAVISEQKRLHDTPNKSI